MFSTWHGDSKDLARRTASNKIVCDKAFNIVKNLKCDGYQRGLTWMDYKFFDKKTSVMPANKFASGTDKNEIRSNRELAEGLHKPIIRKFDKGKVHSSFIDNFRGTDIADAQLISKVNQGARFLCALDIFKKCTWGIPLKYNNGLQILLLFKKT